METEEYFPRGGAPPPTQHFRMSTNFLGKPEKVQRKKKRTKKSVNDDGYQSDERDEEYESSVKSCAMGLHISSIKEGTTVLGRVREALDTKLYVTVPGRLEGSVMACHVSEAYNRLLQDYVDDKIDKVSPLTHLFRRGQYVVLKVLDPENGKLMFSAMPQHVNSGMLHSNLTKGVIIQGAVSSVEDHGYVIETGVPKATVFLPTNLVNEDIKLQVGQVTWCSVKKHSGSAESSVITVTNKLQSLQESFIKYKETDRQLSSVAPSTACEFVVDKALMNGIEGRIFNDTTAYIQRYHMNLRGKKPRLGDKIRARLLYVLPVSKVPFLTMRGVFDTSLPNLDDEQTYKDGDIIKNAKVLAINKRNIFFKLGEHDTGLLKINKLMIDEELEDEDVLAKSYPLGSEHSVRIMSYNLSDYVYTISNDASILREKYFSWSDIHVGDFVDARVHIVNDTSIVVNIGRLTGIIPQAHMSDMGIFVDPKKASNSKLSKKKFKVGQEVRARILLLDRENNKLHLTLKPSLMQPDVEIIKSYEQPQVGKSYRGFIKYIENEKVLIGFFNNVTASIAKGHLSRDPIVNISEAFHIGQIVNCTILKVRPEIKRLIGSLTVAPFDPEAPRTQKRKLEEADSTPSKEQKQRKTSENSELKVNKKKKNKGNEEKDSSVSEDVTIENKNKRKKQRSESESSIGIEADISEKTNKKSKFSESNVTANKKTISESNEKKEPEKNKKTKKNERSSESESKTKTDLSKKLDKFSNLESSLTSEDMILINLDDCVTHKHTRKRIVSLQKSINNRIRRTNVIEKKIETLLSKGLNAENKPLHMAMLSEKVVIEERIKSLAEALTAAQEKLKDLGEEEGKVNLKKKKRGNSPDDDDGKENLKKDNRVTKDIDYSSNKKEKTKTDKKEKQQKPIEIKVADGTTPALEVPSVKDFWSLGAETIAKNINQEKEDSSSSSEEEPEEQPKKKRKKLSAAEKVDKIRQEEERIRALERAAALESDTPRSSEQFERLLLANPDSSQLWIAYMAFYLQATEIEKARAVSRKALKTISFREEQEKLNMWLAMINFENRFGTQESLEKTLEEALQMNEPFKVHSKLLEIYQETSKVQELTALVDLMLKKYKREPTMYTMAGNSLYKLGLVDKARTVMQKAISILEKKDHINVIVQFALMERSMGSSERAEALLEQIVGAYPQRTDVWSVYVDMLYKANDIDNIRQVMERAISHKMAARKMKVLYTKWIEVEEKLGNKEQVEIIRQKALEFIEKAKF